MTNAAAMKTLLTIWLLIANGQGVRAQSSFDPETDTIAISNRRGVWEIVVPEKVLVASAQLTTPQLSAVHDIRVQDIHNEPYLFFRGRHLEQPEFGYTLMVQLVEVSKDIWKAGDIFQTCWGDTCSECGFDDYWGCACERYDGSPEETAVSYCNHMIALGKGLMKVQVPD